MLSICHLSDLDFAVTYCPDELLQLRVKVSWKKKGKLVIACSVIVNTWSCFCISIPFAYPPATEVTDVMKKEMKTRYFTLGNCQTLNLDCVVTHLMLHLRQLKSRIMKRKRKNLSLYAQSLSKNPSSFRSYIPFACPLATEVRKPWEEKWSYIMLSKLSNTQFWFCLVTHPKLLLQLKSWKSWKEKLKHVVNYEPVKHSILVLPWHTQCWASCNWSHGRKTENLLPCTSDLGSIRSWFAVTYPSDLFLKLKVNETWKEVGKPIASHSGSVKHSILIL